MKRLNVVTALLLIAVALALFSPGIGISFVDRDEGWYAQVVREMRASGEWIVPHYLGKVWLGKPPMLYWLVGLSTKLFGWGEIQARLVPVLASVVNVVLVGAFASALFNRRVGTWAGLTFASCGLVTFVGKMLLTDSLLLTFILLTTMLQWKMATTGVTHTRAAMHGIVVGLGMLTKGPVILIFGGSFAIALLIAYRRQWRNWLGDWRWWAWGMLAFVVAVPWYAHIYINARDTFINQFLTREMTSRLAGGTRGNQPGLPGLYLLISIGCLLPWTACVPTALVNAYRSRREYPVHTLLLIWLIVPWMFMELLRSKPVSYVLPCYVPIAILVAAELVRLFDRTLIWEAASRNTRAMLDIMCWPLAICGCLVALGGFWHYQQEWGLAAGVAGTCTAGAFIIARLIAPKLGLRAAYAAVVTAVVIAQVAFGILFLPSLEPHRFSRNLAIAVNAIAQPRDKIILCGYKEPNFCVYIEHPTQIVDAGNLETSLAALPPGQSAVLAITESELNKQPTTLKQRLESFMKTADTVTGINHIKREPGHKLKRATVTVRIGRL